MNTTDSVCPMCAGTGWREVGDDPRVRHVARCECSLSGRTDRLLAQARIPRRFKHCEFSEFVTKLPEASESLSAALLISQRFVQEYPLNTTGLLFIGPHGVGKTHLAVSLIKELIKQKRVPCLFCDYRELLKQISDSYNPSVQATEMEVLRPIFQTEVLLLDDLGAVRPTEWIWDTVSHIINTRYNNENTTIITTNFKDLPAAPPRPADEPVDLFATKRAGREETLGDRISERMRSRLHEMCKKVEIFGKDFRLNVKSASFREY